MINSRTVYINNRKHENPHKLPKGSLEGSFNTINTAYLHTNATPKLPEELEKLEYKYQDFQDHEKVYETDLQITTDQTEGTLYLQINNEIEYVLFKNVTDS